MKIPDFNITILRIRFKENFMGLIDFLKRHILPQESGPDPDVGIIPGTEVVIRKVIEKGIKMGIQVVVSLVLASHVYDQVSEVIMQANPQITSEVLGLTITGLVGGAVEALRNVLKRKIPALSLVL